jgi:hypothetical protein
LNDTYRSERNPDKNTVYLFILNSGSIKNADLAGDMPRSSQFGYIFIQEQSTEAIHRTIAHELGHGRFKLRHTFDSEYGSKAQSRQGQTDNLMDYGAGVHLTKWQWDEIFDPAMLVSPFEGDEDAMSYVKNNEKLYACLEEIRQSIVSGSEIKLRTYPIYSDGEIPIGGHKYDFISIKRMDTTQSSFSIKDKQPELFIEKNLYGEDLYCIGYMNKVITLVLKTKEDRDLLVTYLSEKRSDSFLLFVSGYDCMDEIKEFINKNEDKMKNETWWDHIAGYVKKTPVPYDSKEYWGNDFVDNFVTRLQPKKITYMAGHDNIGTSNHKIAANFLLSLSTSIGAKYDFLHSYCYQNPECVILSNKPNIPGFNQRRNNGKMRGWDYVNQIKAECIRGSDGLVQDTVDIVCHSMGFAHALGIIDILKDAMKNELKGLTLGRFYIIAPENACSGEVNIKEWEEVWQYGSDEENDPVWMQDGVAPQCPIGKIGDRRAYIPSTAKRGFLESHKITNYEWIFTVIKEGDKGYVKPRK